MRKSIIIALGAVILSGFPAISLICYGDSLEVISVYPRPPAMLKVGEKLFVTIRYRLTSANEAHIFARPYKDKRKASGVGYTHPSPRYQKGVGEAVGWFFFETPAKIDEIRIKMQTKGQERPACQISYPCRVMWKR